MADKTIYERMNPSRVEQASGLCFGTIVEVNAEKRFCGVQTFGGYGPLNDQYIPNCQWLSMDSNPSGDESTSIPRVGAIGMIAFVDGEPFVLGYFRGTNGDKGAAGDNAYKGVQGDKVFSTPGGNRLVLKRSGIIELHSKETLRRIMMPTDSQLIDICRNYELRADGGSVKWRSSPPLNTTVCLAEYRSNMARTQIVYDEIGSVDATTIFRRTMGAALPGTEGVSIPQYKHEIKTTGESILAVTPPGGIGGVSISTAPTGAISVKTGIAPANQLSLDVAVSGETTVEINKLAKVSLGATGDIKAENPAGSVSLTKTGDIELKNTLGSFKMTAAGKFTAKGMAAELLDLIDKTLEQQINTLIALQALTVGTGTGPSSPPLNVADFTKAQVQLTQIKALLGSIKG